MERVREIEKEEADRVRVELLHLIGSGDYCLVYFSILSLLQLSTAACCKFQIIPSAKTLDSIVLHL